jgi:hypothetical protein
MAKKWNTLKRSMRPAARRRVDARVKATLEAMPLAELRKAMGMTQVELAAKLAWARIGACPWACPQSRAVPHGYGWCALADGEACWRARIGLVRPSR